MALDMGCCYAKCHYSPRHYAEWSGAHNTPYHKKHECAKQLTKRPQISKYLKRTK